MSHSKLSFWRGKIIYLSSINGSDIYFSNAYKMDNALVTKFLSSVIIDKPYKFNFMETNLHFKLDLKRRRIFLNIYSWYL